MILYEVHSIHVLADEQKIDVIETRRTDKNVAYDDVDLIRSVLFRKAYVKEETHSS